MVTQPTLHSSAQMSTAPPHSALMELMEGFKSRYTVAFINSKLLLGKKSKLYRGLKIFRYLSCAAKT